MHDTFTERRKALRDERQHLVERRREVMRLWRYTARYPHRREQLLAERDFIDQQLATIAAAQEALNVEGWASMQCDSEACAIS